MIREAQKELPSINEGQLHEATALYIIHNNQPISEPTMNDVTIKTKTKQALPTSLNMALLEFQKLSVSAKKDSKNPHFRSNYASLESVIDAASKANEFGLCFTQDIDFDAESQMVFVSTTLIHAPSGESRTSRTPIRSKDPADPQKMGSGITYAKRYGLQAMLGLPSDDDDGNEASKPNWSAQKKEHATKTLQPEEF